MPVLIAEDNATNIEVITSMLELLDYTFVVAEDGEKVVALASERDDIELVLMDVQMPKLDGYAATSEIRRREREKGLARVPIIALTAHVRDEDRQRAVECGMDGFLTKPIDLDELERMLASQRISLPGPAAPAAELDVILDEAMVAAFRKQDMLERVVAAYALDLERGMVAIRESLENGDAETLERTAHFLRGSSATMGAVRVALRAERLEKANDGDQRTLAEELLAALEETRAAIAALD